MDASFAARDDATGAGEAAPDDGEDGDIELDDISNLLEALDVAAEPGEEAATAWEASQLPSELSVDGLKRSFAMLKEEGKRAEQAGWREAFGDQAELTDLEPEDERGGADDDGDEGFGEFVTF